MTDRDRVLRVEADTQHIATVSLQSRHLELQAPSKGSCAVLFVTSLSWKTHQTYFE